MRFRRTLGKLRDKHLYENTTENLNQDEIDNLLNIVEQISEVMRTTSYKTDVLKFLFKHIMDETIKCGTNQEDCECGYEEDELDLTPGEVNAVNVAATLSKDKARGGILSAATGGMFGNPTKNIEKAYGEILNALSQRLTKAAQKIKTGGI